MADEKTTNDDKHGHTDNDKIEVVDNHIYFYSEINRGKALELNKHINKITLELTNLKGKYSGLGLENDIVIPIYLHINSYGGHVSAALSMVDTILRSKIPVYCIIEGVAASAATLIAIVCKKRYITPNSRMLIHEISTNFWGKYDKVKDDMKNLDKLMTIIINLYKKYTKIPNDQVENLLKRDLWWGADECLEYGLVNEILV